MPDRALNQLQRLRARRDDLDSTIAGAVSRARAKGLTWEAIGQALGVTKQAAQQRYG